MKNTKQMTISQLKTIMNDWCNFCKGKRTFDMDTDYADELERSFNYHIPDANFNLTTYRLEICKKINAFVEACPDVLQVLVDLSMPGAYQDRMTLTEFLKMDSSVLMDYLCKENTAPTNDMPGFGKDVTPHLTIAINGKVEKMDGFTFERLASINFARRQNHHYNGWDIIIHHYEYMQFSNEWMDLLADIVNTLRNDDEMHLHPYSWRLSKGTAWMYHTQSTRTLPFHLEYYFPTMAPLTSVTTHISELCNEDLDKRQADEFNVWNEFMSHVFHNKTLIQASNGKVYKDDTLSIFYGLLTSYGLSK